MSRTKRGVAIDATGITDSEFESFRDLFYARTGILFKENKRYFVDKRLIDRIHKTGHQSFADYFRYVRLAESAHEFQILTNVMTVNETYFFRDDGHFKAMVHSMLDQIVANKRKGEMIRIWSVPSSTGEEPYSIALYLLEYWPKLSDWNVQIIASDINTEVLERCNKGIYSKHALRFVPQPLVRKYFAELANGEYQINLALRKSVNFFLGSILDAKYQADVQHVDIIFCRNLLIYFDDVSRKQAVETLYGLLNPGGFVLLGSMESMSRISSRFQIQKIDSSLVYQKGLV
ncbi:MAG: protein-glutamate O-methyltransferase CheR [Zetaproteobacteria bacterium]|nr:protein-glutamate O-methyltransferase CheR [Zetaproteobacteria bacterium]